MSYPGIEQYREALQNPRAALLDAELKNGEVVTDGMGLPRAMCGGFALTYRVKVAGKGYAVRCFSKESPDLQRRYRAISEHLARLNSDYFLPFEFLARGILIDGKPYPVVKMAWCAGETLGVFLERMHAHAASLHTLRGALRALAAFLESHGMAHGDIQPGNLMVADGGRTLRLIDYDGMFVPALRGQPAAELGHVNFQHPRREKQHFDAGLDRFSFIALDLALQALAVQPGLWKRSQSDHECVVFRVADYRAPASSTLLGEVAKLPTLAASVADFVALATGAFAAVPSLADFHARRNVAPAKPLPPTPHPQAPPPPYQGAYPVIDAHDYPACAGRIGSRVELVGRVVEVHGSTTRRGSPFVFIAFAPLNSAAVKLVLWEDALKQFAAAPDASWTGRWISTTGLLEPPFMNAAHNDRHVAVTIGQASQIHLLSADEADYRLGRRPLPTPPLPQAPTPQPPPPSPGTGGVSRNADIVRLMSAMVSPPAPTAPASVPASVAAPVLPTPPPLQATAASVPLTRNQQIAQGMAAYSVAPAAPPPPIVQDSGAGWIPADWRHKVIAWLKRVFAR